MEAKRSLDLQAHFGALTPARRSELDEQIALRDTFEQLFKRQATAARGARLLGDLDVSIAVKTLLGGLQWSMSWYRPAIDRRPGTRERLAEAMVNSLLQRLATRKGSTGLRNSAAPSRAKRPSA